MAHLRGGGGAYSRRRRAIVIEIFKCAQPDETYRPDPEAAWKVHNCCCSCDLLEVARLGDDHEIGKRLGHARKRRVVLICHDADARLRRRGGAADTARTKTENTSQHADARTSILNDPIDLFADLLRQSHATHRQRVVSLPAHLCRRPLGPASD